MTISENGTIVLEGDELQDAELVEVVTGINQEVDSSTDLFQTEDEDQDDLVISYEDLVNN